jgi:hypothetical protein
MENILSVDFELNTVAKTRKEWIQELIEYELDCLDSASNVDDTISYLLTNGFTGYKNMSDIALIDEIYETLGHNYHIEEYITEAI